MNAKILLLSLLILLSLIQGFAIFRGGYYDNTDSGLVNLAPIVQLSRPQSAWNYWFYTGFERASIASPSALVALGINAAFSLANPVYGTSLFYGLVFALAAVSMFYLVLELLHDRGKLSLLAAFFGSVLYAFYFYPHFGPTHNLYAVLIPLALWLLVKLHEAIAENKPVLLWGGCLTLCLAVLLGLGNTGYLAPNLMLTALPAACLAAFGSNRKRMVLWLLLCFGIALLANIAMLQTTMSWLAGHGSLFYNGTHPDINSAKILDKFNEQDWLTAVQVYSLPGNSSLMGLYANNSLVAVVAQTGLVLIGVFGFAYLRRIVRYPAFMLGVLICFGITLFLYVNVAPPFGGIFSYLLQNFPVLNAFRAADPVLYYAVFFCESLLFALGFKAMGEKLKGNKLKAFMLVACLLVAVHFAYFNIAPLLSYSTFQIPAYVMQAAAYLNVNATGYNVATFPSEFPFGHHTTYYYGTDVLSYLVNAPVWTGGYVAVADELAPTPQQYDYFRLAYTAQTHNMSGTLLRHALDSYGIRYVVVEGDTAVSGTDEYLNYSYDVLGNNLEAAGLVHAAQFGSIFIYENPTAWPLSFTYNSSFYLRQSYDAGWQATYPNGSAAGNHVQNGYMNEWIGVGGRPMQVAYTEQHALDVAWYVSSAFTFAALVMAAYGIWKLRYVK